MVGKRRIRNKSVWNFITLQVGRWWIENHLVRKPNGKNLDSSYDLFLMIFNSSEDNSTYNRGNNISQKSPAQWDTMGEKVDRETNVSINFSFDYTDF